MAGDGVDDHLTVGGIGHPVPLVGGMQHLHVRLALLHHLVHGEGEEKFGFELPPGTVEEFAEFGR